MAGALVALGPAGEYLPLRVDATGALLIAGGGGGGGGGDASAANQLSQITLETAIRDRIIMPAALDADGGLKTHVQNFPGTQPVSGTVDLSAASLAALESITATIANWPTVQPVSDNGGSLTVDAPVGTPVFVRLSDGTTAIATLPVSGPLTDVQLRASAVPVSLATVPSHAVTNAGTFAVQADTELPAAAALADAAANPTTPIVGAAGLVYNGATFDRARGNTTIGTLVGLNPATLIISATGAASAAVTATLPAAGVGLFHYITRINIAQVAGITAGAAAAPLVVTTTNLPGSLAITRPTAIAAGTSFEQDIEPVNPIKASAANTATTIVAPVHTNIIWRINVYYYTAP